MIESAAILTIDCAAIRNNYSHLRDIVSASTQVAAVVKANAYGLGAAKVTAELIEAGCTHFFVANLTEAIELRKHYPDIDIMIFNGFYNSHADLYIQRALTPVIGSFSEIKSYTALGNRFNRNYINTSASQAIHLHPAKQQTH